MKKKVIILVSLIVVVVLALTLFIFKDSFGFFKYLKKGDVVNIITVSGIDVDIISPEDDALNLVNSYPIYDYEASDITPFVFDMTTNKNINYVLTIENDTEKQSECKLDNNEPCPLLSTDYIKFSYKKNDGTYSEPALLSSTDGVIDSGIINNETIRSSIRLWIDSDAGNEIMNHYFYGKIIITGTKN